MQSVPITTKVVGSNSIHGEVNSIQHYVIQFCKWLATGQWYSHGIPDSSTNKDDRYDITELLLKVVYQHIV